MKYIRTTLLSRFSNIDKLYISFLLALVAATGEILIKGLAVLSGVIYAGLVVFFRKKRIRAHLAREAEIDKNAEKIATESGDIPANKRRTRNSAN